MRKFASKRSGFLSNSVEIVERSKVVQDEDWECTSCTFCNKVQDLNCMLCAKPKKLGTSAEMLNNLTSTSTAIINEKEDTQDIVVCTRCTYHNPKCGKSCEMCGSLLASISANISADSSSSSDHQYSDAGVVRSSSSSLFFKDVDHSDDLQASNYHPEASLIFQQYDDSTRKRRLPSLTLPPVINHNSDSLQVDNLDFEIVTKNEWISDQENTVEWADSDSNSDLEIISDSKEDEFDGYDDDENDEVSTCLLKNRSQAVRSQVHMSRASVDLIEDYPDIDDTSYANQSTSSREIAPLYPNIAPHFWYVSFIFPFLFIYFFCFLVFPIDFPNVIGL